MGDVSRFAFARLDFRSLRAVSCACKELRECLRKVVVDVQWSLLVIGDEDDAHDTAGNPVKFWDEGEDEWRSLPPLPFACCAVAAVVMEGQVYVLGFSSSTEEAISTAGGTFMCRKQLFVAYDRHEQSWQSLDASPFELNDREEDIQCAVLDGGIYVMGYQPLYRAGDTPQHTRYRGHLGGIARFRSNGSWELLPSCPGVCGGVTMIAASGALYLIGGSEGYNCNDGKRVLDSIFERFDPGTGQWTSLQMADDELQDAVRGGPHNYIIPLAKHIFVSHIDDQVAEDLTGDPSLVEYQVHTSWWYDCAVRSWTRGAPMPTVREHAILPLGNNAFALGDGIVEACQPGRRRGCWSIYAGYDDDPQVQMCTATRDGQIIFALKSPEDEEQHCEAQCFKPNASGGAWIDLSPMPAMHVLAAVAVPAWKGVDEDEVGRVEINGREEA